MKKSLVLLIIIAVALALDGALPYDIFDFPPDSLTGWLTLLLVIGILGSIFWAESAKKHGKENNLR